MTYIPTKETLFELGFEQLENKSFVLYEDEEKQYAYLYYNHPDDMFSWYIASFFVNNISFYPQSIEDIRTLIRLLTPQ